MLVSLRGTHNLRDTGGLAASAGDAGQPHRAGLTRWGKLYRSDALHRLDDADRRELRARRVGLVVDLRDGSERADFPSDLRGLGAAVAHVPVLGMPPRVFLDADASLDDFYDHIVEERGHALVEAVRVIARSGATPTIVHCTSGKDRTGLVVALALALVGVDRATIVADYAVTERHLPAAALDETVARLRRTHGHAAANLEALVRLSPPAVLTRIFDRIEVAHGSMAGYARAHGLADDDVAALADALIAR